MCHQVKESLYLERTERGYSRGIALGVERGESRCVPASHMVPLKLSLGSSGACSGGWWKAEGLLRSFFEHVSCPRQAGYLLNLSLWWALLFCYFVIFSSCISGFVRAIFLSPFWGIWLNLYQFCLSFKRSSSCFHWSVLLFRFLFLFSALIFIISFLLLFLGFCSFSPLGISLGCWRFF